MTTIRNKIFNKTAISLLGIGAFAIASIATLFAFEATSPFSQATNEAHAWQCESISATPDTVYAGEPVTLEWSFGLYEEGVTVTIDQLPGQEWEGTTGSVVVYPTETVEYRVVAHKEGMPSLVFDCCTTVTVLPPEDPCEDVTLDVKDHSFTYDGPPALSYYKVNYCDGTQSGIVEGSWSDPVTIDVDKEIQSVFAKGGQCEIEDSRPCTPPEKPKVPLCPFTPSESQTVIDFNGGKERTNATLIRSDGGTHQIHESVTLSEGTYTVKTASWDGYNGRENVVQPKEQWNVKVGDASTSYAIVGPTTDLQDYVVEDMQVDTIGEFTIMTGATELSVKHAAYPDSSSPNSVVPVCVALEKKTVEKEPYCEMNIDPKTIYEGESAVLSWDSEGIRYVDIPGVGTGLSHTGTQTVTPATTTTYTGAFKTKVGSSTIYCEETITVKPKIVEPEPWCELNISPQTIKKGENAILSWNSEHVTNVDITNVGTGLSVSSSTTISPATTTTYTGTFYKTKGGTLTCENTITVTPPTEEPNPQCAMSISPSRVDRGANATLTWTTSDIVSANINQGIGSVPVDGSQTITVQDNTTYTGTFTPENGEDITCSASVSINTGGGGGGGGGGGSCLNCEDDDDEEEEDEEKDPEPEIVLGKTISRTGGFITLSEVPYTGFKAGPLLTVSFWLFVLFLSFVIAYTITQHKPFRRLQLAFATNRKDYVDRPSEVHVQESVLTEERPTPVASRNDFTLASNAQGGALSEVEEIAHSENILLSPEALRVIQQTVKHEEDSTAFLTELFQNAKSEFPREDGWILLSKERIDAILNNDTTSGDDSNNTEQVTYEEMNEEKPFRVEQKKISNQKSPTLNTAVVSEAKVEQGAPITESKSNTTNNVVVRFVEHLLNVQKKEAFDLLRNISSRGVDVATFMTLVVRQLDEVYKHRIEGNRSPENELVNKTKSWDTEDFETVLGILVECIDYSYSNNRIGTKIALAKAFEHFDNKK